MKQRIILFGGTFDPVHLGHTQISRFVAEKINADKIILIPAKRSPLKRNNPIASDADRVEMLKLATADQRLFEISDCELKRPLPSYTSQTVIQFRNRLGKDCSIFWLIGQDMLSDLSKWHKIDEILDNCEMLVMLRGGCEELDLPNLSETLGPRILAKIVKNVIYTPKMTISSSQIRELICSGQPITGLVCDGVADYIRENNLYLPGQA